MKIFEIKALDVKDYEENEFIDFYISKSDIDQSEALAEWADRNDMSASCFRASEVDRDSVVNRIESIDGEIEKLQNRFLNAVSSLGEIDGMGV